MSDSESGRSERMPGILGSDPNEVEPRPQNVIEIEEESLRHLMSLTRKLAPHMEESVILDERWWEENKHMPGIHVSVGLESRLTTLRSLQMFKFVLLQAVQTTVQVFCDADILGARQCNRLLEDYNVEAKAVWEREEDDLLARRRECKAISKKVFGEVDGFPAGSEIRPVPRNAAAVLDSIFKAHYNSEKKRLLFGRADEKALEVQDRYGVAVAKALGKIDQRYGARATLHLRKRYGRGAPLPLLSMASAEAMWEVCSSGFYRLQIRTVSSNIKEIEQNTKRYPSSIRGLSRFRRSWRGWSTASHTASTGSFGQKKGRTRLSLEMWVWIFTQVEHRLLMLII